MSAGILPANVRERLARTLPRTVFLRRRGRLRILMPTGRPRSLGKRPHHHA
jgi:hypothetical protein